MELGICMRDLPVQEVVRLGNFSEDHGYSSIYLPETGNRTPEGGLAGRSPWISLAAMFAATEHVGGAVGVAAAPFRSLPHLALSAATLNEQSNGRFSLGIGVSHREAATRLGVPFPTSPLRWMEVACDELMGQARFGVTFGQGFPVLVGALGPKMVEMGAARSDGLVLNWLTPEHAQETVTLAREVGRANGRTPYTVLYVRLSPYDALHTDAVNYDAMINYHQHFERQGLTTPEDVVAGTCLQSDDVGQARDKLAAWADAGIDLVCVYPHGLNQSEYESALAELTK
jgi:alkanesulfonate monooxygenase SsuD/methylene tetrahydromethanopterin reductase-like flavin-dependent oxidoreductase (luciferase family)|tara:strand:- start:2058 stop:2915 length:858 start_codon:yes stop_codon:yes gene_type:complete